MTSRGEVEALADARNRARAEWSNTCRRPDAEASERLAKWEAYQRASEAYKAAVRLLEGV